MKLKKLLCGVLATTMLASASTITAVTSASAKSLDNMSSIVSSSDSDTKVNTSSVEVNGNIYSIFNDYATIEYNISTKTTTVTSKGSGSRLSSNVAEMIYPLANKFFSDGCIDKYVVNTVKFTGFGTIFTPNVISVFTEYCQNKNTSVNVILPSTLKTIGVASFSDCSRIHSLTIPASVSSIQMYAFDGMKNLTNINVNKNNKSYSSVNGVLYNKNGSVLVQYPVSRKDKSFTVPSSTKEIGMCSFANCSSIENINIYNCTKINAGAFGSCKNLKSITASKSLKYIGDSILGDDKNSNCDKFSYFNFYGTKSQWNKIEVDSDSKDYLKKYKVKFYTPINIRTSLQNSISSYVPTYTAKNNSFFTKITPKSGYLLDKIVVSMNGKNIPVSHNNNYCNVNISKVTGPISITAVSKKPQSISANSFTKNIKSKPFFLNAKAKTKLSYTSSNKKVATVNSKGKVTVKGTGRTVITIRAHYTDTYKTSSKTIIITIVK